MSTLVRAGYFGRGGVKARLHVATVRMRAWCRRNGRSTALRKFTQDNLVLKDKNFPEAFLYIIISHFVLDTVSLYVLMCVDLVIIYIYTHTCVFLMLCVRKPVKELHAKGYDAYIILQWLRWELETNAPPESCAKLMTCIWCADTFMNVLCGAQPFMSDVEIDNVQTEGNAFLKTFISLHHDQPKVWRLRPKFHLLWHVINDPALREASRNTSLDSTWLDEDWIKKVQKIMEKMPQNDSTKNVAAKIPCGLAWQTE